jgi:hypothetical protein
MDLSEINISWPQVNTWTRLMEERVELSARICIRVWRRDWFPVSMKCEGIMEITEGIAEQEYQKHSLKKVAEIDFILDEILKA